MFLCFISLVTANGSVAFECTRMLGLIISMSILIVSVISLYLFNIMIQTVNKSCSYLETTMAKDS